MSRTTCAVTLLDDAEQEILPGHIGQFIRVFKCLSIVPDMTKGDRCYCNFPVAGDPGSGQSKMVTARKRRPQRMTALTACFSRSGSMRPFPGLFLFATVLLRNLCLFYSTRDNPGILRIGRKSRSLPLSDEEIEGFPAPHRQ